MVVRWCWEAHSRRTIRGRFKWDHHRNPKAHWLLREHYLLNLFRCSVPHFSAWAFVEEFSGWRDMEPLPCGCVPDGGLALSCAAAVFRYTTGEIICGYRWLWKSIPSINLTSQCARRKSNTWIPPWTSTITRTPEPKLIFNIPIRLNQGKSNRSAVCRNSHLTLRDEQHYKSTLFDSGFLSGYSLMLQSLSCENGIMRMIL